ncbi:MAG: hypothetical protein MZW92_14500 [Comamonadaceae bacterium]|nr:hypothetical protein [Comamonadaceae bacterium]
MVGRRRRAGADAHRRRQVAVLPDPGARCAPGVGVVVSPLIALMQDQVGALDAARRARRVPQLARSTRDEARARRARSCCAGELDLLYVAPERC